MIKAQLSHNPYLMETKVLFNNRAPRINSLVEKYQDGDLYTWIKKIPSIFYDEMNGYDFELEYSGTRLEFEELKKSFLEAGVSDSMVHLFLKNELDDRDEKQNLITALITWLMSNPNEMFDFGAFVEEHRGLLIGKYPFLIIERRPFDASLFDDTDIEVEHISGYQEVESTDLHNTPIVFYISEESRNQFQIDLREIMSRPDIIQTQLFFIAHASVDAEKVERIVMDLGIENPQFISDLKDPAIKKYIDIYPRSEYIYQAIRAFRQKTDGITELLDEKNRISEIENKVIYEQVDTLSQTIRGLKNSLARFSDRDNIDIPATWIAQQQNLLSEIRRWRIKKTKISGIPEGEKVAGEFEEELQQLYRDYLAGLNAEVIETKQDIWKIYSNWYEAAEYGDSFESTTKVIPIGIPDTSERPAVKNNLLQLKEEKWVQPKEDLFGLFFKSSNTEQKDPVLETTYYYQRWRDYVSRIIAPMAEHVLQSYYNLIQDYEETLARSYIEHLQEIISEKTVEKDKVSSNLSGEEQNLQNNNKWLATFVDQLEIIERR